MPRRGRAAMVVFVAVAVCSGTALALEGGIAGVAFSRDGRFAAIGGGRGAEVIEVPGGHRVRFIEGARVQGQALALSADGGRLAAVGGRAEVRIWDVASGREIGVLNVDGDPWAIAFSPRGDLLAVGGEKLAISLWDLAKRRPVWRKVATTATGEVRSLAFSADGRLLLSGASVRMSGDDVWNESPRVWDAASGAQIEALDEGQSLTAASADWRRIAGAGCSPVRVWERPSGREIATLQHFPARDQGRCVIGVGLTPDGTRAISLGSDGSLAVWDVAAERELWRIAAHPGSAEAFAASPDGRYALTAGREGDDGRARLWDLRSAKEVPAALGRESFVRPSRP